MNSPLRKWYCGIWLRIRGLQVRVLPKSTIFLKPYILYEKHKGYILNTVLLLLWNLQKYKNAKRLCSSDPHKRFGHDRIWTCINRDWIWTSKPQIRNLVPYPLGDTVLYQWATWPLETPNIQTIVEPAILQNWLQVWYIFLLYERSSVPRTGGVSDSLSQSYFLYEPHTCLALW